jgi:threonyl-tRNA synthetase
MRRRHQCATIQLDFQLPERFDLIFQQTDGTEVRPVMIHRAILGSVERMIAILTENYAGKWPFWLSPRQISVVPVAPTYYEYAKQIRNTFLEAGFFVDVDDSGDTMNKKIRNAQVENYNFIFGTDPFIHLMIQ